MRWVAFALVLFGVVATAVVVTLYGVLPAILAAIGGILMSTGLFVIDVDRGEV